jgi:hypothetical protein
MGQGCPHPAFRNKLRDQEASSPKGNGGREAFLLPGAASSIRGSAGALAKANLTAWLVRCSIGWSGYCTNRQYRGPYWVLREIAQRLLLMMRLGMRATFRALRSSARCS